MFEAGAHYGYSKSKRHPTTKKFIYGVKNNVEILDLEKTSTSLEKAVAFIKVLGEKRATILFVGGKNEAREIVKSTAESIGMPYVAGRWIGGTLTNFSEIRKRIQKLLDIKDKKEKGELDKYTKKERLLIDRDQERLENTFGGVSTLKRAPEAMVVVDSGYEEIAVDEARKMGVPVVAIANTDCDLSLVDYPIPANDTTKSSIELILRILGEAYREGLEKAPVEKVENTPNSR